MRYRIVRRINYPDKPYFTAERSRLGLFWQSIHGGYGEFESPPKEYEDEKSALKDIVDDRTYVESPKKEVIWVMRNHKKQRPTGRRGKAK